MATDACWLFLFWKWLGIGNKNKYGQLPLQRTTCGGFPV